MLTTQLPRKIIKRKYIRLLSGLPLRKIFLYVYRPSYIPIRTYNIYFLTFHSIYNFSKSLLLALQLLMDIFNVNVSSFIFLSPNTHNFMLSVHIVNIRSVNVYTDNRLRNKSRDCFRYFSL